MTMTYEEFEMHAANGNDLCKSVLNAEDRLTSFYREHWYEGKLVLTGAYDAYRRIENQLNYIIACLEKNPFQIAREEIASKNRKNVNIRAYQMLAGEITPEQCYPLRNNSASHAAN